MSDLNVRVNPFEPRGHVMNPIYESSNYSQDDEKISETQIRRRRDSPRAEPKPGTASAPN